MAVAIWSVSGEKPLRLSAHSDFVERHLEEWIEREPSLVMEGLRWVARQPVLPDRSKPDLIGLTREGALVVAELKRGVVGVETLAQALGYVIRLGSMEPEALIARLTREDSEERALLTSAMEGIAALELSVLLIGTGKLPALDDAASFLAARGLNVPIKIVTFTPFADGTGQVLLARNVEDHDVAADEVTPSQRSSREVSVERVRGMARDAGVVATFDSAIDIANRLGLRVKPWPKSITIVPPFTRGRTLIYLAPRQEAVHFGYSPESLARIVHDSAA